MDKVLGVGGKVEDVGLLIKAIEAGYNYLDLAWCYKSHRTLH